MAAPCSPGPLYRVLSAGLFLFWLGHALWHALQHRQMNYFWQRLGISPPIRHRSLWLHAASVGEVALLKPLVQSLAADHPVVLTTFTASGYQHAQRIMPPGVLLRVLPIDFYPLCRLFALRHRFTLGLVTETELWPEMLSQLHRQAVPLVQINARLSPKTLNAPVLIRRVLRRTLGCFDRHLARTRDDADYLEQLGAQAERIVVSGNLKYAGPTDSQQHPDLIGRPYILFASSHAGEERLFSDTMLALGSDLLPVIAPRHPQRSGQILKDLAPLKLDVRLRSRAENIDDTTDIYLADTLGEMKALMAHARIVVMGGSFDQTGGHNVLEPAQLGKPIVTGPSDYNIRQDLLLLQQHQAIVKVEDADDLTRLLGELLDNPVQRQTLGENARRCMQEQAHVFEFYRETISAYL